MPPAQPSPIRRRRRLGSELRTLREAARLTGDQVVDRVGWASASKLSRLENGRSRPDPRDVLDLLDLYQVTGQQRDDLLVLTEEAGDIRAWLRAYPVMTPQQQSYAELEAGCVEILEYSPVVVPGLLQTPNYARVRIMSSRPLAVAGPNAGREDSAETEVAARQARQSQLTREPEPPHYRAVLEEAALGRRAGPPEVVHAQLVALRRLATLPNVTLQVLPREATIGNWYLPHTAFSLYRFADPQDPETVAIEGLFTNLVLTDTEEINRYRVVFEWLQAAALPAEDTLSWLAEAAGQRPGARASRATARGPAVPPTQRSRRTGRLTEQ